MRPSAHGAIFSSGKFNGASFKGYYTFNASDLTDSSAASNDLSDNGSIGFLDGLDGKSADFTPIDYASSTSTDFDPGSTDFSFGTFVNYDTIGVTSPHLVSSGLAWLIRYEAVGTQYVVFIFNGASNTLNFSATPDLLRWYHIVVTVELGVAIRLYIDGTEVASNTTSIITSITDTAAFKIGSGSTLSATKSLNGRMDYSFFTAQLLSADDVSELYNGGSGLPISKITF